MINQILTDATTCPSAFFWRGPLLLAGIEQWEATNGIHAPQDLKELWATTGGGDIFESETILQPFGVADDDMVVPVSKMFWDHGLSKEHYVFHTGLWISVFRESDSKLLNLNSDMRVLDRFSNLDDWYRDTLRSEYAESYGLSKKLNP